MPAMWRQLTSALDALSERGEDDTATLRSLLEAVLQVGRGLDLDEALQRIVDVAVQVVDARYAAVGVRAAEEGGLDAFVYTGITAQQRAVMGPLPVGGGVLGVLIEGHDTLRIDDLASHPASVGFPSNHPPMTTFLGAPVVVRGEVFGSIYTTEKRGGGHFTARDESALTVLSVAASIAIDNARLFESAQTRLRWLRALISRGSEPLAGVALQDTLSRLCDDVTELSSAVGAYVVISGRDGIEVAGHRDLLDDTDFGNTDRQWSELTDLTVMAVDGCDRKLEHAGVEWVTLQPLTRMAEFTGMLVLGHRTKPHWNLDEVAGMSGAAEVAAGAMVFAEQSQLAREIEVLGDRHRIARDLHDLVIQRLFALGMSIQSLLANPGAAGTALDSGLAPVVDERLRQVVGDLDATIAQIRTSIFDLQTQGSRQNSASLRRRVLDVVSELAEYAPISPGVHFEGPVDTVVPESLGPHLEAVLREGLSNALRHAEASRITVMVRADDVLTLEISDDGKGLTPGARYRGLENLRQRAEECRGSFNVRSTGDGPDRTGTTLVWSVPTRW